MKTERSASKIAVAQGAYWAVTGIWPILHLKSFTRVTGPKPEGWLVKTMGGLITVVGATLAVAGLRRRVMPETALLAAGSAAALGLADAIYAGKRRISPVYLADAAIQAVTCAAWARVCLRA